jgi:hypothetical protein
MAWKRNRVPVNESFSFVLGCHHDCESNAFQINFGMYFGRGLENLLPKLTPFVGEEGKFS